jgi:nitroreductase
MTMSQDAYETLLAYRSVRHFTAAPIPEESLTRILQAGRWAGSAKNTQPWHFIVVRERETLQQLATCGRYASHLSGAAAAVILAMVPGSWADFDAGRASQNIMLAAWTEGVGSCIASLHDEDRARDLLGIPPDLQAKVAISLGYSLEDDPQTIEGLPREQVLAHLGRQPLDKLVHWETW